ncbi:hypothetical protein ACFOZ5_13870 [Marinobacter lacisalsi]|uniref:Uncharacterized protein n=1 Tax=Marinobacter lacisalsi TaxID=475979 RepID=A0ABV8QK60_9GAMM
MTRMLKAKAFVTISLMAGLSCSASASGAEGAIESEAGRVMLEATLNAPEATLPAEQACLSEEAITVGEYLADTLGLLTEGSPGKTQLTMSCDAVTNSPELQQYYSLGFFPQQAGESLNAMDTEAALFQCTLGFQHQKGELAWSRSLQALVNITDETIVEGTRRCLSIP